MPRKSSPQPQDKYVLRLPDGMRDQLKEFAAINGRSLNAEIIDRLRTSIERWPQVSLPDDLMNTAVRDLPLGILLSLSDEIENIAITRVTKAVRDHELSQSNLMGLLEEAIEYAPEDQRHRLKEELRDLLQRAGIGVFDF